MLSQIGKADGHLVSREEDYISRIAERLNIPLEEKQKIMDNPSQYVVQLPETYSQRLEFFYNLLFMMGIDDNISEEEEELCREIGFRLCFNPMLMDDLIKIMIKNVGKKIPVEEVVQAVVKYQN